jgi:hypothetical protein
MKPHIKFKRFPNLIRLHFHLHTPPMLSKCAVFSFADYNPKPIKGFYLYQESDIATLQLIKAEVAAIPGLLHLDP